MPSCRCVRLQPSYILSATLHLQRLIVLMCSRHAIQSFELQTSSVQGVERTAAAAAAAAREGAAQAARESEAAVGALQHELERARWVTLR